MRLPFTKTAVIAAGSALALTWWHEREAIAALGERLSASAHPVPEAPSHDDSACPPVVARYLRLVLAGSSRVPSGVEIKQAGVLRASAGSARWLPFQALHRVAIARHGFLWNAKVNMAPAIHVRVLDSLIDGVGAGKILLQSIIPVACKEGNEEMNAGSLHRFLAEAVWYPWVLVPGKHLTWRAVADDCAEATISIGGTSVSLMFHFARTGELIGIFTPARWGSFSGGYRQLPWEGHFRHYAEYGGILVPSYGEVGWYHGNKLELVWRGRIRAYRTVG